MPNAVAYLDETASGWDRSMYAVLVRYMLYTTSFPARRKRHWVMYSCGVR